MSVTKLPDCLAWMDPDKPFGYGITARAIKYEPNGRNRSAMHQVLESEESFETFQRWCCEVWEWCDPGVIENVRIGTMAKLYWYGEAHMTERCVAKFLESLRDAKAVPV